MCAFADPIARWATAIEAPLPGRDVENGNRIIGPLSRLGRHNFDVQHEVPMFESESTQLGLEAPSLPELLDHAPVAVAEDSHRKGALIARSS